MFSYENKCYNYFNILIIYTNKYYHYLYKTQKSPLHYLSLPIQEGYASKHNGSPIKGPLMPLSTILPWCTGSCKRSLYLDPIMPRGALVSRMVACLIIVDIPNGVESFRAKIEQDRLSVIILCFNKTRWLCYIFRCIIKVFYDLSEHLLRLVLSL